MNQYIVTFFTHFDAICCARALKKHSIPAVMAPVPRALSSSCGTCVQFECPESLPDTIGDQFEQVFQMQNGTYRLLLDRRM